MTDLTTTYLGLTLRNPLVASPSPIAQSVEGVRRLADAGVGAVVLPSLMEEQVRRREVEEFLDTAVHEDTFGEASTYWPETVTDRSGAVEHYLDLVAEASATVDVPVIASLNGAGLGGWTAIAGQLAEAGAAAVELNIYALPSAQGLSGADVEQQHVDIVRAVREAVDVSVAVKLSPYFSSTADVARRLVDAGADGLVLFNRFLQPDIDTEAVATAPGVYLSYPDDGRLPRTWIALLRHQVEASLALTSGVWNPDDVVKGLLAGADVVMTTSALLHGGLGVVGELLDGTATWLARKGARTVDDARGLLAAPPEGDAGGARAGYVSALEQARASWGTLGQV